MNWRWSERFDQFPESKWDCSTGNYKLPVDKTEVLRVGTPTVGGLGNSLLWG